MKMPLKIAIKKKTTTVELDADQFERMAANFGFFNQNFLDSLEQAEMEIKEGDVHELISLDDLKK